MRGRLLGLLVAFSACFPSVAVAAPVLVMGPHGRVFARQDPFLATHSLTPPPGAAPAVTGGRRLAGAARVGATSGPRRPRRPRRPPPPQAAIRAALLRLYRGGRISQATYASDASVLAGAVATLHRLRGTPAAELGAVIDNLHQFALRGQLTPSRLPALFLTLLRNRQWWSRGQVPATWQRVEFSGSQLVWQYYPGQGLELQVLGTFGKADGMYTAGPSEYGALRALLAEMVPLAVQRAGGLAWEYYFTFDGGSPPWVSAMAQGTAIEALTRASEAFGDSSYLSLAHRALALFTAAPPLGVRIPMGIGARYLQYSFAPTTDIINAFLQSLIGLYDYAHVSGDQEAQRLFAAGDAQARAELPRFDTGAWSLYQPGVEDSLDYHELVTGFLDELCARTQAPEYCATARRFHAYLKTPPALTLLTTAARPRTPIALRFRVSKPAHVGVVVLSGQRTIFLTSASFDGATNAFAIPALRAGSYTIHLAATDLAGNFNRIVASLKVARRPR